MLLYLLISYTRDIPEEEELLEQERSQEAQLFFAYLQECMIFSVTWYRLDQCDFKVSGVSEETNETSNKFTCGNEAGVCS